MLSSPSPAPVYARPRPVAHSLIPKVDQELEFLEQQGVIERINNSTWAHPIVIIPRAKGMKIRVCADLETGINRCVKVDDHPLQNSGTTSVDTTRIRQHRER